MRNVLLLIAAFLFAQATITAGQYRYRIIAKPGDVVADQTIDAAVYPSLSGNSVAYRVSNMYVAYLIKDGSIVVKKGDFTQDSEKITNHGRVVISGSHLAYMATSANGVTGIVRDGVFVIKRGDVIDGKKIGGVVDFAMTGSRLAFSATDYNDDSKTWLFFDGKFVAEVVGKPGVMDCMLAYTTQPDGMALVLNGDVFARTRGQKSGAPPPTFVDGFELTWIGQPAISGHSFAFVARSQEGYVSPGSPSITGPFIVKDGHILVKNGDVIDGKTISAASDPAFNEDGTRMAFKVTYFDPVLAKSCEAIAVGEEGTVKGVAQLALGEGLFTTLTVVNNGTQAVSGNIEFVRQDGSPWMQFGSSTDQTALFELPPGGSKEVTGPAGGATTVGHAVVTSLGGPVDCFSTFAVSAGGKLITTATVLGHAPARALSLPVRADSESQTGIAIANSGSDAVNVKLTLVSPTGTVVKSSNPSLLNPLGPRRQVALFLGEFFPDVKQFQGTLRIEVEGIGEVVATGIVVRQGLLSAVPVTPLESQ